MGRIRNKLVKNMNPQMNSGTTSVSGNVLFVGRKINPWDVLRSTLVKFMKWAMRHIWLNMEHKAFLRWISNVRYARQQCLVMESVFLIICQIIITYPYSSMNQNIFVTMKNPQQSKIKKETSILLKYKRNSKNPTGDGIKNAFGRVNSATQPMAAQQQYIIMLKISTAWIKKLIWRSSEMLERWWNDIHARYVREI